MENLYISTYFNHKNSTHICFNNELFKGIEFVSISTKFLNRLIITKHYVDVPKKSMKISTYKYNNQKRTSVSESIPIGKWIYNKEESDEDILVFDLEINFD